MAQIYLPIFQDFHQASPDLGIEIGLYIYVYVWVWKTFCKDHVHSKGCPGNILIIIYIQIGRRPKWKTTKMEDDQNERRQKWKMTKIEDGQIGR